MIVKPVHDLGSVENRKHSPGEHVAKLNRMSHCYHDADLACAPQVASRRDKTWVLTNKNEKVVGGRQVGSRSTRSSVRRSLDNSFATWPKLCRRETRVQSAKVVAHEFAEVNAEECTKFGNK